MHRGARNAAAVTGSPHVERMLEEAAPALLGYFLRRVQASEDAADLVSDALITAWRGARRMPSDPEAARMWVFGVARNVLRHHERGQRRRTAATIELAHVIAVMPRSSDDADAIAVRLAVDALPAGLGELIRLVHWDGFSVEQAATLTGVRASTARSRHARAKALLRAALEDPDDDVPPRVKLSDEARR